MPDTAAPAAATGTRPEPSVTAQPHRLRLWCAGIASFIVVALTIVAILLPHSDDGTAFHRGDQYGVFGVGVLIAAACWLPTRPRLRADRSGLYVRGIIGPYKAVPWTLVRSVEFRARWQWARAVLPADETISLYAVQRLDAVRSVAVMRALRQLHAAAHDDNRPDGSSPYDGSLAVGSPYDSSPPDGNPYDSSPPDGNPPDGNPPREDPRELT